MDYRQTPSTAPLLLFGSNILAVDRATGEKLWEHSTDRADVVRFTLDGDRLFVLDSYNTLHILAATTGQVIAQVKLETPGLDNMMIDDGRLYIVGKSVVLAIALDGQILWKQDIELHYSRSSAGMAIPGGNWVQVDYSNK